jgi:hypothetical protein
MLHVDCRLGLYAHWFWAGDAMRTRCLHSGDNRLDIGGLRLCCSYPE